MLLQLLVTIAFTIKQVKSSVNRTECLGKNQFLSKMFPNSIDTYPSPSIQTGTKCGEEWGVYGTCCKLESLRDWATKDENSTWTAVHWIQASVNSVLQPGLQLLNLSEEFVAKFEHLSDHHYLMKYFSSEKDNLSRFIKKLSFDSLFNRSIQTCALRIIKVRHNSLCSVCSGRSEAFFTPKKSKALVSEEICKAFFDGCEGAIGLLLQFISHFDLLISSINVAEHDNDDKYIAGMIQRHRRFSDSLRKGEVFEKFAQYERSDPQHNSKETAALCATLVSLVDRHFIITISFMFGVFSRLVERIMKRIRLLMGKMVKNDWKLPQSRLQRSSERLLSKARALSEMTGNAKDSQFELFSDVKMFTPSKIDSSYAAVFGAIGTSGNEAALFLRPLPINLTMEFP